MHTAVTVDVLPNGEHSTWKRLSLEHRPRGQFMHKFLANGVVRFCLASLVYFCALVQVETVDMYAPAFSAATPCRSVSALYVNYAIAAQDPLNCRFAGASQQPTRVAPPG